MQAVKRIFWMLIFFTGLCSPVLGQVRTEIEGKVLDKETREPIPFANVYNTRTQKGTISNTDGYF